MKNRIIFIVFLSILPVFCLGQADLTSQEISYVFEYKDVAGTIGDFRSSSKVDMEKLEDSYFEGSVGVGSLKTGNFLRDWAVKGRKYFNEDDFPRIEFRSTKVLKSEKGIRVEGQLTMKGKTNPLIIQFQRTEKGLTGTAELSTSDYGISIKKKREENKVTVTMKFELR